MNWFVLLWLTSIVASIFIYLDATVHRIGKIQCEKGFLNIPAGGWAVCCMIFPIVMLFVYLLLRKNLIENAKTNPVSVSTTRKVISLVLLVIFGFPLAIHPFQMLRSQIDARRTGATGHAFPLQ
jgi:hypothetical protein